MSDPSRREFIKLSAQGTAALVGSAMLPRLTNASASGPAGDLSVWVTDETQRLKRASSVAWQSASASNAPDTVVVVGDLLYLQSP